MNANVCIKTRIDTKAERRRLRDRERKKKPGRQNWGDRQRQRGIQKESNRDKIATDKKETDNIMKERIVPEKETMDHNSHLDASSEEECSGANLAHPGRQVALTPHPHSASRLHLLFPESKGTGIL